MFVNGTADDSLMWRDLEEDREQVLPVRVTTREPIIIPDGRALLWTREGSIDLWDRTGPIRVGTLDDIEGKEFTYPTVDRGRGELWLALDGWFRRVPLDSADWVDRACQVVGRSITVDEWASLVPGDEPYRDVCQAE